MNIPSLFKKSVCTCGKQIEESSINEIGVDINDGIFFMRFVCEHCKFNGKVRFSKLKRSVPELCRQIAEEGVSNKSAESSLTSKEMFELYKNNIGCWHIPDWTEESAEEYVNNVDRFCK